MTQGYFTDADCDLEAFRALTSQATDRATVPLAAEVIHSIPVYDMGARGADLSDPQARRVLMAEWAAVMLRGAGAIALRGAMTDHATIDAVTQVYLDIIAQEKAVAGGASDHFAKAGANDRIWNSLQKLCLRDPALFARYFGNPTLDAVSEAWLGRGYQMTAQVNLVRPGGAAQQAHRDYHLGFQTPQVAMGYPAHMHDISPVLTLQGAVAHCDMPVDSGPTKLLPFSQMFRPGYIAYHRDEFRAYFEQAYVQIPLAKGDMLFFNPALFHAAGENRTRSIDRMANLLQVSSPFGIPLESIDRPAMCRALYPALQGMSLGAAEQAAAIACAADGYSFSTNLDTDPPVGGLAPETMATLMARMLADGASPTAFHTALDAQCARRAATPGAPT